MTENQEVKIIDPVNRLKEAFGSPLFLTLAILVSVVTGVGIFLFSFNIFYILTTIGVWLVYASAKSDGALNSNGLAMISGTAKAVKIVSLVMAILIIVLAVVFAGLCSVSIPSIMEEDLTVYDLKAAVYEALEESGAVVSINGSTIEEVFDALEEAVGTAGISLSSFFVIFIVIVAVSLLIIGAVLLVLSLTFCRTLHKFHKSVCENAKCGAEIQKAKSLKVWLMVLGILSAIGALSAGVEVSMLSSFAGAGVYIVGSVWVSKYFCSEAKTEEQ